MFLGTTVLTVSDLGQPSDTVLVPALERNPPHTGDPQVRAADQERLGVFLHSLLQTQHEVLQAFVSAASIDCIGFRDTVSRTSFTGH